MIILEKPYISEFLIDTIVNNDWQVLENNVIKNCGMEEDALNLISSEDAKLKFEKEEYPLIYSNSENSINWIIENLPESKLTGYIKLFKDKVEFRKMLAEIYPDYYFQEVDFMALKSIPLESLHFPFVVKPAVGFLSLGVHTVNDDEEWKVVLARLEEEMTEAQKFYPPEVVCASKFILEEFIDGEEYAIDAYYDKNGIPVILNIFQHPFLNAKDVRDRIYIMSTGIMIKYMSKFAMLLKDIGDRNDIRNFPIHIEVRVTKDEKIIPIEVNPMRFAGWCTTDVSKYAWGINVYECFMNQTKPDWNEILGKSGRGVYYFSMAEVSPNIEHEKIKSFDYDRYLKKFSNILELRRINPKNNPLFAVIFGQTYDKEEVKNILKLNTQDYTNLIMSN